MFKTTLTSFETNENTSKDILPMNNISFSQISDL